MTKRTIIPFGPQHPVLPEPIHLDLVLEDEKVIQAIPSNLNDDDIHDLIKIYRTMAKEVL